MISPETKINIGVLDGIRRNTIEDPYKLIPFTNDIGISSQLIHLARSMESFNSPKGRIRCGLVVGTGGIFSFGKELPMIDQWIVVDKNIQVHKVLKTQAQVLLQRNDWNMPQLAKRNVVDATLPLIEGHFKSHLGRNLKEEVDSFGPFHYLSSRKNLSKTKEFLKRKNISYVGLDFTVLEDTQYLATILAQMGCEIVFANMTNVHEHMSTLGRNIYKEGLISIPFSNDVFIQHSSDQSGIANYLRAQANIGVDNYLRTI